MSMTDVAKHFTEALQRLSAAHDAVYEAKAELRRLDGEHKATEDAVRLGGLDGKTAPERDAQLRTRVAELEDPAVFDAARKAAAEADRDMDICTRQVRFLQSMADFEANLAGDSTSALASLTAQEAF